LYAAHDGEESLPFLKRQNSYRNKSTTDLDLSKKDSCDVLKNIQTDPTPMQIPEIILTTSKANEDISQVYNPYANCYITKPVGFKEFVNAVQYIVNFWLKVAELPPPKKV
jgi:chemotaxis family two-component system response regulator Rcp1